MNRPRRPKPIRDASAHPLKGMSPTTATQITKGPQGIYMLDDSYVREECLSDARSYEPDLVVIAARAFADFMLKGRTDTERRERRSALCAFANHPMPLKERLRRAKEALAFLSETSRKR